MKHRLSYAYKKKRKKTKMPIWKGFQYKSKFACLYNSVKRLFPFICGRHMPAIFSLLRATADETRFCRDSSALYSSTDTMTDETSRSDNCRLNLGLNDFSHERGRRCQCASGAFGRLKIIRDFSIRRVMRDPFNLRHNLRSK